MTEPAGIAARRPSTSPSFPDPLAYRTKIPFAVFKRPGVSNLKK